MMGNNIAEKAIRAFTAKQRMAWRLVMQECKTETEAGLVLGISRDCVHDRLLKARRKFTKIVKQYRKNASLGFSGEANG